MNPSQQLTTPVRSGWGFLLRFVPLAKTFVYKRSHIIIDYFCYHKSMKFEWDEGKNQTNLIKHGFDFTDAYRIFNLPMVVELDERENYREDRFVAIGLLDGRVVVIVYTEPDDQTIRIISLRKALSYERKYYEQYIKNRLE
jgi:uncharacterized DUF497 family protein